MHGPSELLALCAHLPQLDVEDGTVLIEEGSTPQAMYVLAAGLVSVERDAVAFARIDQPGAVLGEMSVVLGRAATATVRAVEGVTVHVVDDPQTFFTEHPGAALAVLRVTAARVDALTQYLVDVKRQYAGLDGHLGMVDRILDTLVHQQAVESRPGSTRDPEGTR